MRRREFIAALSLAPLGVARRAQAADKLFRIAFAHPGGPEVASDLMKRLVPFFEELQSAGFRRDRDVVIEFHYAGGRGERYPEFASEVVRTSPDLIITSSSTMIQRFREVTSATPIVAITADPVAFGIATTLGRPGGNVTGVVSDAGIEIWGKRIELLKQLLPSLSKAAFLTPRSTWDSIYGERLPKFAHELGVQLSGALIESPMQDAEYRRVFTLLEAERPDAVFVAERPENFAKARLISQLASGARLPTMAPERTFVQAGCLSSYGTNLLETFRHLGRQAAQVFRGVPPGEIPFFQPTTFELLLNERLAADLGLTLPPSLLARADEVIE